MLPFPRQINKRSLENFSEEVWNDCLDMQDWSGLENCESMDEMVDIFSININNALDKVAPIKCKSLYHYKNC